jgi:Uncharacterized protein conserved in bacteria (DUF2125)
MRRRRKFWSILLVLPFVLLAAITVYWRIAAGHLQQGFADWVALRRANGWTERNGATRLGGWPFAATLTVPAMSLASGSPGIPGGITWSAERVVLRVALTRPDLLEIMPQGTQQVRLASYPSVPYTVERFSLLVPIQAADWPSSVQGDLDNLHASTPAGSASLRSLQLHLDFHAGARTGEPALAALLHVADARLPGGVVRPLGPSIADLQADAVLSGPLAASQRPAEAAAAWRDGGGSLEIQHLGLSWGPLILTASATLALDDQLQPMGAGNARITGYAETLDTLAAHSMISHSAGIAAKAVLSLLADARDDGSRPEVEVPLTLQYRTLSMRQVPLLRLPELDWP